VLGEPLPFRSHAEEAVRSTQFTCFTSTKVQILTQKALLGEEQEKRERYRARAGEGGRAGIEAQNGGAEDAADPAARRPGRMRPHVAPTRVKKKGGKVRGENEKYERKLGIK
jgi:hypothetical protein